MARVAASPAAHGATYHVVNRAAARFVDLATIAGLPLVELDEWVATIAERASRFAKLAVMVRRSHTDAASGADELHFAHNRTYDDWQLRAALGDDYRPPPMDAHYLARFASALRAT